MTTNLFTVPVSISNYHNTKDNRIDMKLRSSSTNTMSSTTTDTLQEKPADTIEK